MTGDTGPMRDQVMAALHGSMWPDEAADAVLSLPVIAEALTAQERVTAGAEQIELILRAGHMTDAAARRLRRALSGGIA